MDSNTFIIDFNEYCNKCKHKALSENLEPCSLCLDVPARENDSRPVYFKEDDKK